MKFNSDEIASVLQKEIEQYEGQIDVRETGTVLEVGDGIARVYGLSGVMAGEMVEFPGGVIGLAFNLEENSVGVIAGLRVARRVLCCRSPRERPRRPRSAAARRA